MSDREVRCHIQQIHIERNVNRLDPDLGKTASEVDQALRQGDPSIRVRVEGDDLFVVVHTLNEGEERIMADRLRQVLAT